MINLAKYDNDEAQVELTALRLKRIHLPLSWAEQRRLLGFES